MKHAGLTVFLAFFGLSLLDALSGGHWGRALFWLVIGWAFWRLERPRLHDGSHHPPPRGA